MARSKAPTLAVPLLRPLLRLLRTHADIPNELTETCARLDATRGRVTIAVALEFWESAAKVTGDPDLGLRAALFTDPSDYEVLEWVATSAATWRDACETVCRYARVLNEAAEYRVEVYADKAHIILGTAVSGIRETRDFQLAAFHVAIQRWFPETWPELAIWMKHEQPADISAYRAIFPHGKLVFRAPFDGFVYAASRMATPLPTSDPCRHAAMRAHVDRLLEKVVPEDDLVAQVSVDILNTMRQGSVGATRTASRLGMARRTLVRRLKQHGTSFSELLKEARYRSAIHYLQHTTHSVEEIAFLLGYSECAAFVRAFKRWSGHPPFEYRLLTRG